MIAALALAVLAPILSGASSTRAAQAAAIDERPAAAGEWGFRPEDGATLERTPPPFSWRPQQGAATYEVQASRDPAFEAVDYAATGIEWSVHCPPRAFEPGAWAWRFRALDADGAATAWSRVRRFEIAAGAAEYALPAREELLARIPDAHPRLFLRPEDLADLRAAAATDPNAAELVALRAQCDALVADPPPTDEPSLYEPGMKRGSDPWRAVWWGNRKHTIRALEGAASLAFAWRLTGDERYGALAQRLLEECAAWDPKGATGYRYNDEAGMPYAYHFARAYTLLHPRLGEAERERCREVMRARGREMYAHLAPAHLWRPYSSHSNRAWHFLGEVGIAFHGEIPEADDWTWFAANVFACVYPVWSDADGGWHEGTAYWKSYLGRFTWWADVQRAALGLDAYALPFFSRAGDWALFVMPPGARGGGFGDQNAARTSAENRELMTTLARQARDPAWRWYVDAVGGPAHERGWVGYLRGAADDVEPREPKGRAPSKLFRGIGVAVLQPTLGDATDGVRVLFKSSPFGSQSHGYEAQNSFLLSAFGERLLIRSGKRDSYGSRHHREWMWSTRSVNNVLVDGRGQTPHSREATGRVTGFWTEPGLHWVEGEAGEAYGGALDSFRREILFVEPDLVVVRDRLRAPRPAAFDWLLHAPAPFAETAFENELVLTSGGASCRIRMLAPQWVEWTQTDRFDPPPRERVQLVEHHLTARSAAADAIEFLVVLRPYRAGEDPPAAEAWDAAHRTLRAELGGSERRTAVVELGSAPDAADSADADDAPMRARVLDANGEVAASFDGAEGRR